MLLFSVLLVLVLIEAKKKSKTRKDQQVKDNIPVVNITKWQYCEGCLKTVDLYSTVVAEEHRKLQSTGEPAGSTLQVKSGNYDDACKSKTLEKYEPFIRYSCMKIFDDHNLRVEFLKGFEGSSSVNTAVARGDIFNRKKEVSMQFRR